MNTHKLSVMIPARDRTILTQKCIQSIWAYSSFFQKIDIYVFDNGSDLDVGRFAIFEKLLKERKICYYSYDTSTSLINCFGKATTFMRWCQMMEIDYKLRENVRDPEHFYEKFYLLIDNDFIVCPRWWEYMISGLMYTYKDKNIHYLVPNNGGIPSKGIAGRPNFEIVNHFNRNEKINIQYSSAGGSSGFWFMNYEGLSRLKWDIETLRKAYNQYKRQDTETWNMIRRKNGMICYVAGVVPQNNTRIALHLGPHAGGSLCNKLQQKIYDDHKQELIQNEKFLENMSLDEIINMFKDKAGKW